MQLPKILEVKGSRVLTSKQLAQCYAAKESQIKQNFSNNRERFVEGKHYISFTGDELRKFKNQVENFDLVANRTSHLYLWTEKGALLHAKSLNTDKAWEVYDYLVDFYFRAKEQAESDKPDPKKKRVSRKVDVPENCKILDAIQKIRRDLICMDVLLEDCSKATWESTYKERSQAAADLLGVIATDYVILFGLEPNVLEEKYY